MLHFSGHPFHEFLSEPYFPVTHPLQLFSFLSLVHRPCQQCFILCLTNISDSSSLHQVYFINIFNQLCWPTSHILMCLFNYIGLHRILRSAPPLYLNFWTQPDFTVRSESYSVATFTFLHVSIVSKLTYNTDLRGPPLLYVSMGSPLHQGST